MKELVIAAKQENLDAVLDFVAGALEGSGCPDDTQVMIGIAVEELFVNIAHYAYAQSGGEGGAVIRVSVGDQVSIEFEDDGIPYNPLLRDDPDIEASFEERQIGGLGIHMVKHFMDQVEYTYAGGKNKLQITKNITAEVQDGS